LAPVRLIRPSHDALAGFAEACRRGWSRDNVSPEKTAATDLAKIEADPEGFLASMEDVEAKAGPITLPDGTIAQRLPGFYRWLWDGEFAGSLGFRWQPGTSELPPHVLGHMGYSVTPWKQGRGYATEGLRQLLPEARALGLEWVELTTDPGNIPSQRVILNNGGVLVERFRKPEAYGGEEGLRYRIHL
jgi:predicted acetyltransferase